MWRRENPTKGFSPTGIFRSPKCPYRAFCSYRLLSDRKNRYEAAAKDGSGFIIFYIHQFNKILFKKLI
jgi:hypothetical protein